MHTVNVQAEPGDVTIRDDTHGTGLENHRITTMLVRVNRIKAKQLAAQVKAVYELVSTGIQCVALDAARVHRVYSREPIADPKQMVPAR
ncbi:MAG: hypothetical protein OES10_01465 [Gammaproteobacteria bacterium]|nr:hypothetical protein [Gammaproteobacteria bacterium]